MTFISIKMAEGPTPEQKDKMVAALIEQVAGTIQVDPAMVTVLIEEHPRSNWYSGSSIATLASSGESHDDLKKELRKDLLSIYERSSQECNYRPNRFLQFVQSTPNSVTAAKHLIKNTTEGFTLLWELNRLDLSVEALVLSEKYRDLFTDEERDRCHSRLKKAGYFSLRER